MEDVASSHRIRPAGRHLLTIGADLIKDPYAAIVELAKNGYDADSPKVIITFKAAERGTTITVEDFGHGMTKETVVGKWLVPSTADKLSRKESPNGRVLQGRKGIGRYSASILGEDLLLETSSRGVTTTVYLEWEKFRTAEYLEDVEILVDEEDTGSSDGTKLTIFASEEESLYWKEQKALAQLKFELQKLISPIDYKEGVFDLEIEFENLPANGDFESGLLRPYDLLEHFDYKITGRVTEDGQGCLTYSCQKAKNISQQKIDFVLGEPTSCGAINFDIRVYDREPAAIQSLIDRGLKHTDGTPLGKVQAKNMLDEYNGVAVYRNGFRIRPLGDPGYDWLSLNSDRIQNPSMRIGGNQVIGFVEIESEEVSDLVEKSARDGLKENFAYLQLKAIAKKVISELESRRFSLREKTGIGRNILKVEKQLSSLFSYDDLKDGVAKKLKLAGASDSLRQQIFDLIDEESQSKESILEVVRKSVAVYQGQATLGRIMSILLHEGRHPLSYFKSQAPNLNYLIGKSEDKIEDYAKVEKIIDGFVSNTDVLVDLFKKVDPLASGRRANRKDFSLDKVVLQVLDVFESAFRENNILVSFEKSGVEVFGWQQDYYIILTNIIDNSVFWIAEKNCETKEINVSVGVEDNGDFSFVRISDSGPGLDDSLLESGVIFEPNFTTKSQGSGLGLAISGEAAVRNSLELVAVSSDEGAVFELRKVSL